ncbi:hypothetical protein MMC10_002182 [Thelotrema lepadinum]|nr:hypothetical protein [Thelotrema lepadinum]
MGPTLKRRKIIDTTASKRAFSQSIVAFGRVTKTAAVERGKRIKAISVKSVQESDSELEHKKSSRNASVKQSKKRGREEDTGDTRTGGLDDRSIETLATSVPTAGKSQLPNGQSPSTPTRSRKKAKIAPRTAVTDTPTKGARTFLESFAISSSKNKRSSSPALQSSSPLPVRSSSSPTSTDEKPLDAEVQDLVDLHTAFVNALSLYYAHNGTSSPANVRHLIPSIERRWGRRRIGTEDIQRVLGIQQHGCEANGTVSCLSLVDYGKSKICIEFYSQSDSGFPVEALRNSFSLKIQQLNGSGKEWPLAEIAQLESEQPGQSKGAQRLAEIRAVAINAQPSTTQPKSTEEARGAPPSKPGNRAASLVDRIREKEAYAANLPTPPSAEALARRAALMRLEEIIPVLEILSGSSSTSVASKNLYSSSSSQASLDALMKPNLSGLGASLGIAPTTPAKVVSFTLGTLIQHLQNSLKHPIARDEAERCVRLLAKEVMPQWVGIREVVKVVAVTFRGKLSRAVWTERLRELIDCA